MTEGEQVDPKVIVALDFPDAVAAMGLVDRLEQGSCRLKVGKELFTRAGPVLVEQLVGRGFDVFLDLKFHDIPNTVASACRVAADLGVWMLNVHALGGERMMLAAREGLSGVARPPKLVAVTILTSLNVADLAAIGLPGSTQENVTRLAILANKCGLDGVVCSSLETAMLRDQLGSQFILVTPGIRPAGTSHDDQARIMTPVDAMESGASYLVVGRPVTQSDDPVSVLRTINSDLAAFR